MYYTFADFSNKDNKYVGQKKEVRVKGFWRKGGGLVKPFVRRVKPGKKKESKPKLNTGSKVALGIAALVGIPATTYLALKFRYIKNLDKAAFNLAKNYKPAPTTAKEAITFTVGGFDKTIKPGFKELPEQAKSLARWLGYKTRQRSKGKARASLVLDHEFIISKANIDMHKAKDNFFLYRAEGFKKLSESLFRGNNPEAISLAQDVYNYAKSNPGKPLNIVGFSAGTNVARDAGYMLHKQGIKVNIVSLGTADLRVVPNVQNTLSITSKNDTNYFIRSPKSIAVNSVKGHAVDAYLKDPEVQNLISKFLNQ